jgi:hypothetical protein
MEAAILTKVGGVRGVVESSQLLYSYIYENPCLEGKENIFSLDM